MTDIDDIETLQQLVAVARNDLAKFTSDAGLIDLVQSMLEASYALGGLRHATDALDKLANIRDCGCVYNSVYFDDTVFRCDLHEREAQQELREDIKRDESV